MRHGYGDYYGDYYGGYWPNWLWLPWYDQNVVVDEVPVKVPVEVPVKVPVQTAPETKSVKVPLMARTLGLSCESTPINAIYSTGDYVVNFDIGTGNSKVLYWAPKPGTFPWGSMNEAYRGTNSKGAVMAKDGDIEIRIPYPGSYFDGLNLKGPLVHIFVCDTGEEITIDLNRPANYGKWIFWLGLIAFFWWSRKN